MRKIPKKKILRSLLKQYKKTNNQWFRYNATKDYLAIIHKKARVAK